MKNKVLHGISAYDHVTNTFYISEELIDKKWFGSIVNTDYFAAKSIDDVIEHELGGHKAHWDAIYRYQKANDILSLEQAKTDLEIELRYYVLTQMQNDKLYIDKTVSRNASKWFAEEKSLNELIADAKIKMSNNIMTDDSLEERISEVLNYDGKSK